MTGSLSYFAGPLVAGAMVGVFVLALRWSYRRGQSVVAATPRAGTADDYGLLVAIASPATYDAAQSLCDRLAGEGIRASAAQTLDGPRVLVWPQDAGRARRLLAS